MCGIVGYIGAKEINEVLLKALSRLEYRGYDSAGVASVHDGRLWICKESGKLTVLSRQIQTAPLKGSVGIGHTRWATHGEPSQTNAHPHYDCTQKIALVHNGIIENHEALRKRLNVEGHEFRSDTDSEILAHLIESYHLRRRHPLEEAVRLALENVEGSYALCVISADESEQFVAARNGSPLVLGIGSGENFVASDAPAILNHTKNVIFLEDYQMAVVTRDAVRVTTAQGQAVEQNVTHVAWDAKEVTKEGFDHFMLKEIEEQPAVIERILRTRLKGNLDSRLFDCLRFDQKELMKVDKILIQACGTSWHAALTAKFLFEELAGLPTDVDVSSEFRYRALPPQRETLVLSITQSGETIDTLMGLRHGKAHGCKTLSICNVLGSTITRESEGVIYTHAGPEIGVASTKAYTAQLAVLCLLSLYWGRMKGMLTESRYQALIRELNAVPQKMRAIIASKNCIERVADRFFEARDFLFLGRGINYPNAHEGALKIKEVAYIHATGHPAGEMKHGPIALIDKYMPVVALAPRSSVFEKMVSNIREVHARKGRVIALTTHGQNDIRPYAEEVLYVPDADELISPLLTVVPLQYLAYYVARRRGTDLDQPRNLAKSVTVE